LKNIYDELQDLKASIRRTRREAAKNYNQAIEDDFRHGRIAQAAIIKVLDKIMEEHNATRR